VGTDRQAILSEATRLLEEDEAYRKMAHSINPYGDGRASERIAGTLLGELVEPFVPQKV
jgi:UDP-N-acetylglucosamine 2-epimerase (non-hydrolysing)